MSQRLQFIGSRDAQIVETHGSIQLGQAHKRIAARFNMSCGKRRDFPVAKKRSVSEEAND
jgi:hypothetical protein